MRIWAIFRSEADSFVVRNIAFALALVVFSSVLTAVAPVIFANLIDRYSGEVTNAGAGLVLSVMGAYILTQLCARISGEIRWWYAGRGEQRLERRLSARVFGHVIRMPFLFHLDRKTGATNQTLSNGLLGYRLMIQNAVFTVLPVLIELVTMIAIVLILFSYEFGLILFLSIAAYCIVFAHGIRSIFEPSRQVAQSHLSVNAVLTDSLLNFEPIKSYAAEDVIRKRYDATLRDFEERWGAFFWRRTQNGVLVGIVFAISLGAVIIVSSGQLSQGAMTLGSFVLINTYIIQIVRPLELIGFAFRDVAQGAASVEKMLDLLDEEAEPLGSEGRSNVRRDAFGVEFSGVSFSYPGSHRTLSDVSFTVKPGSFVGIVGPSGSGKSSITRLLMGHVAQKRGTIVIGGVTLNASSKLHLRREIAIVPQDTILFDDTIAFNIGLGVEAADPEKVDAAVKMTNLQALVSRSPEGLMTKVGERGLKISGGEKQRIAIARAAVRDPKLYIFDEATSSLDPATEKHVLQSIKQVSSNTTTLMVTHRLSTVVDADEIIVIEDGVVKERGDHSHLMSADGLYARMWRSQNSSHYAEVTLEGVVANSQ